jgi:Family of unknown function (DUF5684)
MKICSRLAQSWRGALALVVLLIGASGAFAQDDRLPRAAVGGFLVFSLVITIVMYAYMALALQTIANKTNTENAWLAWIPIVNIVLMLNIAKKPIWWIILFLIPLVNIVVAIIVWMGVAEARNKPSWWGVLLIVPLIGIIVPGYLAWSD